MKLSPLRTMSPTRVGYTMVKQVQKNNLNCRYATITIDHRMLDASGLATDSDSSTQHWCIPDHSYTHSQLGAI